LNRLLQWVQAIKDAKDAAESAAAASATLRAVRGRRLFPEELFTFAAEGNILKCKAILDQFPEAANQTNTEGATPTYLAAENGHAEILHVLIAAQADVNKTKQKGVWGVKQQGLTPTFVAASNGHAGALQALVEWRADVHIARPDGATPIFQAAQNGHVGALQVLIAEGADVKMTWEDATTIFVAAREGHAGVLQALIQAEADMQKTWEGQTPIFRAAKNGHVEALKVLIDNGANVNERAKEGSTPTFTAAFHGHPEVLQALLAAQADVHKSFEGLPPIEIAEMQGHNEATQILRGCQAKSRFILDAEGQEVDQRLKAKDAKKGKLTVSLWWDQGYHAADAADLNLHVATPNGQEISYQNKKADRVVLDVDMTNEDDNPVEHIYFAEPPSGTYEVYVTNYTSTRGVFGQPKAFKVSITITDNLGNSDRGIWEGTVGRTSENDSTDLDRADVRTFDL